MNIKKRIPAELKGLKENGTLRTLQQLLHDGKFVERNGMRMLNLSSNDYLGLSYNKIVREEFMQSSQAKAALLSSSSSRLLTGNFEEYEALEAQMGQDYGKSALIFNDGYHANTGILPALATAKDVILADKLVHASLIDGIRLSAAKCVRFRHNDLQQLKSLVDKHIGEAENIFIVVESVYSMDGDCAPLSSIVELKRDANSSLFRKRELTGQSGQSKIPCTTFITDDGNANGSGYVHKNGEEGKEPTEKGQACIVLYVDEAHAIGVRGERGLGLCEELGIMDDVDIIMGTLGKGAGSAGAFAACSKDIRNYLINKARSFIFTTALPPFNIAWTNWVWNRMKQMRSQREHLKKISRFFIDQLMLIAPSPLLEKCDSQIVPLLAGSTQESVRLMQHLQKEGFYLLPIRPPTVPEGTSRLRFSLTAEVTEEEIKKLVAAIGKYFTPLA